MKLESLVIANQHVAVNTFPSLVHTARHTTVSYTHLDVYKRQAKEYAEKTGANYLHLLPTADLYEIALKNVTGVPTSYFVDENGHILKEVVGAQSKDDWAADIEELLEG